MHTKYTDASTVTVGPGLWCMSYSSGVWGKEKKKKFKSYAAFTTKELCFSEGKAYLRFYFLKREFCVKSDRNEIILDTFIIQEKIKLN